MPKIRADHGGINLSLFWRKWRQTQTFDLTDLQSFSHFKFGEYKEEQKSLHLTEFRK